MRIDICQGWIAEDAFSDGKVDKIAHNDNMSIIKLHGKDVFRAGIINNTHHTFLLVTKGKVRFMAKGEDVVVISPTYIEFIVHYRNISLHTDEHFEGYLLAAEQSFFQSIGDDTRSVFARCMYRYAQKPILTLQDQDIKHILPFIDILLDTISRKEHFFQHGVMKNTFIALHFEIWNIIFRELKDDENDEPANHWNDVLSNFLYLMHTNCCRHHDVGWYAEKLCVSPNTLSVKLKRAYGKSAGRLIDECIMEEAKIHLRNPSNSIQDVAEMLSFSDQAVFYKFFKRYSGMSPSEFQKISKA